MLRQQVFLVAGLAGGFQDNHSSSGQSRKSDIVCDELLCGRKEILNTALKSLGYTSTGLSWTDNY